MARAGAPQGSIVAITGAWSLGPLPLRACRSTQAALTRPATGSVAALISRATGVDPYYVGKPNPLMMRSALNAIEAHSESTAMIGDRMDTDVISGIEAGMRTILVLTGSTKAEDVERFSYRPSRVVNSIADVVELVGQLAPAEAVA